MEFRDLGRQYLHIRDSVDEKLREVIESASFIGGRMVEQLEHDLASYTNLKHCITCGNGTDALQIALMAWGIGEGDAVFVPDFTFFSSGEVVSAVGATPVFIDVRKDTFNIDIFSLEKQVRDTKNAGILKPRAIIAVDLFGQPAEYEEIRRIADAYNLKVLEDGAQGFGGKVKEQKACTFGDISTTSFFPAKPLGCYGDGGAIFTNNDEWANLIRSIKVHGKGSNKYDNIRIGMNSRLDSMQAAVLAAKLPIFMTEELNKCQEVAYRYTKALKDVVSVPVVLKYYVSSWAQYTIRLENKKIRDGLQAYLKDHDIPSMIYYQKPMHKQKAFENNGFEYDDDIFENTNELCDTVLSLPFHPYMEIDEIDDVCSHIRAYLKRV